MYRRKVDVLEMRDAGNRFNNIAVPEAEKRIEFEVLAVELLLSPVACTCIYSFTSLHVITLGTPLDVLRSR